MIGRPHNILTVSAVGAYSDKVAAEAAAAGKPDEFSRQFGFSRRGIGRSRQQESSVLKKRQQQTPQGAGKAFQLGPGLSYPGRSVSLRREDDNHAH
jgi:hypothetical protein